MKKKVANKGYTLEIQSVENSGYTGSGTATCDDGSWDVNATCEQDAPAVDCAATTMTYCSGRASVNLPDAQNGDSQNVNRVIPHSSCTQNSQVQGWLEAHGVANCENGTWKITENRCDCTI